MGYLTLDVVENQLVVPAIISHPNPKVSQHFPTSAIVDTGAEFTTLRLEDAMGLGLPYIGSIDVSSVSSTDICPVFSAKVAIANDSEIIYRTRRIIHVIGTNLPQNFPPCLIGMDIITQGMLLVSGDKFGLSF